MVIAIVSDLHGKSDTLSKLIVDIFPSVNEIWWIGDLFYNYKKDEASITEAKEVLTILSNYKDRPCLYIIGNTDNMSGYQSFLGRFETETFLKKKVGEDTLILTHGHLYENSEALVNLAKQNKAKIVISGHTHIAGLGVENDIILVNPGSPSVPRDDESTPTYVLYYPEEKKFQVKHLPTNATLQELYYRT
jgi:putative phosphoesterase